MQRLEVADQAMRGGVGQGHGIGNLIVRKWMLSMGTGGLDVNKWMLFIGGYGREIRISIGVGLRISTSTNVRCPGGVGRAWWDRESSREQLDAIQGVDRGVRLVKCRSAGGGILYVILEYDKESQLCHCKSAA